MHPLRSAIEAGDDEATTALLDPDVPFGDGELEGTDDLTLGPDARLES